MTTLPYTESNVSLVQDFLNETKRRISTGAAITFTNKAQQELAELNLIYDIGTDE